MPDPAWMQKAAVHEGTIDGDERGLVPVTRPSDEKLMAFADGQLPSDEMREVEAYLESDPDARQLVAAFRQSKDLISAAFDDLLHEAPPQKLIDAIEKAPRDLAAKPTATVTGLRTPAARERTASANGSASRQPVARHWALPLAASIALLVGLGVGFLFGHSGRLSTEPPAIALGLVAPSAPLARLLETSPSGTPLDAARPGTQLMAVATFRDRRGRVCREIELVSPGATPTPLAAAVACRDAARGWTVEGAFNLAAPAETGSHYVPSGAAEQDALDGLLKVLGASEVLTAADEARLIGRNWRE